MAGPTRLPFGPSKSRGPFFPPLSPARGRPPWSTRRRPRGGRTTASWTRRSRPAYPGRDATPLPQAPPFCPLPAPSPPLFASAGAAAAAAAPLLAELRRSPPAKPVAHSLRQNHRCTRLPRGKPLRTLYLGEKPPRALNRSPEFLRPRRSGPPRRNLLVSASFRLLLGALGS